MLYEMHFIYTIELSQSMTMFYKKKVIVFEVKLIRNLNQNQNQMRFGKKRSLRKIVYKIK